MADSAVTAPSRSSRAAELAYANAGRRCAQCRRPMEAPEPGAKGRRPRYCGYCRQLREALRFVRAALRRLERVTDPAFLEEPR